MKNSDSLTGIFKRGIAGLLCATFSLAMGDIDDAQAQDNFPRSSVVVELNTGRVLHEANPNKPIPPASVSKLMTAYLVFDALERGEIDLSDDLIISRRAKQEEGGAYWYKTGDRISLETAIKALVLRSNNDIAVELAMKLSPDSTEQGFVDRMNQKAADFGMEDTHFTNPNGMNHTSPLEHERESARKQLTTAADMATLFRRLYQDHTQYIRYFQEDRFVYASYSRRNTNKLNNRQDIVACKTGTLPSQDIYNLACIGYRNGETVAAFVSDKGYSRRRWKMINVLDEGLTKQHEYRKAWLAKIMDEIQKPVKVLPPENIPVKWPIPDRIETPKVGI